MESLKKEFWKHAATIGGPSDIEDIFLSWAANKKLAFNKAIPLWSSINKDVYAAFGKKISLKFEGTPAEFKELKMDVPSEEGVLEQAKDQIATEPGIVAPDLTESKKTLMDSLSEPEEDIKEVPELTTPPAGTPPPPMGAPPTPPLV